MTHGAGPGEGDWIDFLDGSLSGPRRQAFEAWLAEHPEELRALHDIQGLEAELALSPLPEVPEAEMERARRRVMGRLAGLDRRESPATRARPVLLRWTWIPTAAAALVVGVLLGRLAPPWAGGGERGGASSRADALNPVDGVIETGAAELPRKRHLDVQGLDVDPQQGVRILLQETNSYEINGRTTDREVQNTLSYIVRNDRDPQRRQTAIQLLERHCQGQDLCQVLVYAMTQDPAPAVRREAALALQDDRQDEMVRQSFIKMLVEDPSQDLRRLAKQVLAREGGTEAVGR